MLVKRSSKNQVAIPKAILERAGLHENDVYFDVQCDGGRIVFIPVTLEEKISPEALARFEERTLRSESGDREYPSADAMLKGLKRPARRR